MTLENNRAPLLYYIKLCLSFQIHRWIETEVTVRKRSIRVKIRDFLSCVTLKFDGWPWKTIGHLFYTTSSFVHHFKSIGEFKLELQSRNAQFGVKIGNILSRVTLKFDGWPRKTIGHLFYVASSFVHHFTAISEFKLESESGNAQFWSKSTIFFSRVTLKFNGWHWKTIGHLFYATSSFVHHFITLNSGQNRRFFVLCDLEIWWMTLENNRAPLLYYIKLCASFQIHRWIQIWVTVRKRSIQVKIDDFFSCVT